MSWKVCLNRREGTLARKGSRRAGREARVLIRIVVVVETREAPSARGTALS